MLMMRNGKPHMTEGKEQPIQANIRMLEENETYKHLRILEADTVKHPGTKERNKKRISHENEETTKILTI